MAKKCVVSVISRLLRGFFGFGGFFFQQLFLFVIDGRPESGGAAAAGGGHGTLETHDRDLPRDIFFKCQRAYMYRYNLPGKSLGFVEINMRRRESAATYVLRYG
jgi:hypothetical protein